MAESLACSPVVEFQREAEFQDLRSVPLAAVFLAPSEFPAQAFPEYPGGA